MGGSVRQKLDTGKWSKSVECSGRRVRYGGFMRSKRPVKSGLSWGIGFEICGETVWRDLSRNGGQPDRLFNNRRGCSF